jgi:hypothetical protein
LTNHDDLSVPYEANSSEKRMFDTWRQKSFPILGNGSLPVCIYLT